MTKEQDLLEFAFQKAEEARRGGYCFGFGWATQILANEVQALRDELKRARPAPTPPYHQNCATCTCREPVDPTPPHLMAQGYRSGGVTDEPTEIRDPYRPKNTGDV